MMAKILPLEAAIIACEKGIPLFIATANAASDEKGNIVAAKKAEKKSASSCKRI
jgi:hypothetical protein